MTMSMFKIEKLFHHSISSKLLNQKQFEWVIFIISKEFKGCPQNSIINNNQIKIDPQP